jgi:rhodanese-related sulfurtransferase
MTHALGEPHPAGFQNLTPAEAHAHLGRFRVIDVREPDEYVGPLGHVANAELVPLATLGAAAADWPRDAALLVLCRSGGRSANGATQLVKLGFTQVYNMTGGMLGWNELRLPVDRA